jgi:hypothetical protein
MDRILALFGRGRLSVTILIGERPANCPASLHPMPAGGAGDVPPMLEGHMDTRGRIRNVILKPGRYQLFVRLSKAGTMNGDHVVAAPLFEAATVVVEKGKHVEVPVVWKPPAGFVPL